MIELFFKHYYITFKIISDMLLTLVGLVGLFYLFGIYREFKKIRRILAIIGFYFSEDDLRKKKKND